MNLKTMTFKKKSTRKCLFVNTRQWIILHVILFHHILYKALRTVQLLKKKHLNVRSVIERYFNSFSKLNTGMLYENACVFVTL